MAEAILRYLAVGTAICLLNELFDHDPNRWKGYPLIILAWPIFVAWALWNRRHQ